MHTHTDERQYMPRATKKRIKQAFWLMVGLFVICLGLLWQEGIFEESFADW